MIIGTGFIARSLNTYQPITACKNALFFASGVSNSRETNPVAFLREKNLLLQALASCKGGNTKFVYFSSAGEVYGETIIKASEANTPHPQSIYGKHKVLLENLIKEARVPYIICRLPNIVGKGQKDYQLFHSLVRQVLSKKVIVFAHATRDLLGSDDFLRILAELIQLNRESEIINIVSGSSTSVSDIVAYISASLKTTCLIITLQKGDKQQFSASKLNALLPWTATYFNDNYYKQVIDAYLPYYSPITTL